jgi:hypothetical protein
MFKRECRAAFEERYSGGCGNASGPRVKPLTAARRRILQTS